MVGPTLVNLNEFATIMFFSEQMLETLPEGKRFPNLRIGLYAAVELLFQFAFEVVKLGQPFSAHFLYIYILGSV